MNIVRISGGLGNQMFQYAFAKTLEYQDKQPVLLDISLYSRQLKKKWKKINSTHTGYELDRIFPIHPQYASLEQIYNFATLPYSYIGKCRRKFFPKSTHIIEKYGNGLSLCAKTKPASAYYDGYWQSEVFFERYSDVIRNCFTFSLPVSERNKVLLQKYADKTLVSIHIRRGDYLNLLDFAVCKEKYYKDAIHFIMKHQRKTVFFIFSDDIDWCKHFFPSLIKTAPIEFIYWNRGGDSWQDMYLMSKCASNIIANSTFSWWGAWLNSTHKKMVIAPKVWCTNQKYDFSSIVPTTWIKIENV